VAASCYLFAPAKDAQSGGHRQGAEPRRIQKRGDAFSRFYRFGGVHHNSCGVKNMDQLIGQIEETRAEVGGYIAKNPNISTTQDSMNLTTMGPQPKQATTSVTREHVNAANTSSDSKI
jgi:hypothetical protein